MLVTHKFTVKMSVTDGNAIKKNYKFYGRINCKKQTIDFDLRFLKHFIGTSAIFFRTPLLSLTKKVENLPLRKSKKFSYC